MLLVFSLSYSEILEKGMNMNIVKSIVINFLGYFQTRNALIKVRHLKQFSDSPLNKLCQALEDVLTRKILPDEVDYVRRIERLRSKMLASDRQVLFADYGAGSPDITLTEVESANGVTITKQVSEVVQWSKPFFWGLLLFKLVRLFRAEKCLELGTCLGISGSYVAAAQVLSGSGELKTLEGSATFADLAEKNFVELGLKNFSIVVGRFHDTLGNVLEKEKFFDFVFIDGHHDEVATIKYFNQISPHLAEGAVVIFDDIAWSSGMKRAWRKLKSDEQFSLTADLSVIGVCIVGRSNKEKRDIKIPLRAAAAFLSVVSSEDFQAYEETAYLMASPKNAERLNQAIVEVEKNED